MGQGAPETGPLPGAPSRDFHMSIEDALLEYAPVTVSYMSLDGPYYSYIPIDRVFTISNTNLVIHLAIHRV